MAKVRDLCPRPDQFIPEGRRLSYTHAGVEVQERLVGSLVVVCQGQVVATQEAPPHAVTLRARRGARGLPRSAAPLMLETGHNTRNGDEHRVQERHNTPGKPAPERPWRKTLLTTSKNS